MAKVYVTRVLAQQALDLLRSQAEVTVWPDPDQPPPHAEIVRQVREADGLLCLLTDRIDAEVMDAAARLKIISTCAVGYDNIDVAAATARGLLVCNTPGVLTEATADLTWALLLATARRVTEAERYLRAGKWKSWSPQLLLGLELHGATLGIIGFGRIGQAVARRAQGLRDACLIPRAHTASPRPSRNWGPSTRTWKRCCRSRIS